MFKFALVTKDLGMRGEVGAPERAEHSHATDAEHDFLAQPIPL